MSDSPVPEDAPDAEAEAPAPESEAALAETSAPDMGATYSTTMMLEEDDEDEEFGGVAVGSLGHILRKTFKELGGEAYATPCAAWKGKALSVWEAQDW